ncbi:MAG: ATP synthase F0 subunit C [bacterium]
MLSLLNVALAATEETAAATAAVGSGGFSVDKAVLALAAGLCIAMGVLGASKAMGGIAKAALDGTARQPEMSGKLFTTMLIAMALVEALAIYCLLIAFMLIAKM